MDGAEISSRGVDTVVVVTVDALRADRVGCLGSDRNLTPAIDALAEEGVVFENAFACTNATDPSVTSIHTGRYPRATVYHHGSRVTASEKRRVESCELLPEVLAADGIRTVATGERLGRWHRRGFDVYPDGEPDRSLTLRQAVGTVLDCAVSTLRPKNTTFSPPGYRPEPSAVGEFLSHLETVADSDRVYGYVHLIDTHTWYDPEAALIEDLLRTYDYPDRNLEEFVAEHGDRLLASVTEYLTEADYDRGLARLLARYDGTVVEADQKIRRLVEGLKRAGRWENTALLILSDHGESLTEHGIYFDHHGLYDQTVRVPLVVAHPGTTADRVTDFVQLIDVAPTVLDLFGVDAGMDCDGQSLLGTAGGDQHREAVFIEEAHTQRMRSIRTDDWKYIEHVPDPTLADETGSANRCRYCETTHGDEQQLYDLCADPDERENVIGTHPEVAADLRERMNGIERGIEPVPDAGDAVSYDDESEALERLEALGYR